MTDLESAEDIRRHTEKLLRKADALGVYPTPVDRIVEAAGLVEAKEDLFEESVIRSIPKRFRAAFRKLQTKVLAALDRREKIIYVNKREGNEGSIAFRRLHEVAHNILPWQQELIYADDNLTLAPSVRQLFEREANQGGAELLFQQDHFAAIAADYKISIASIIELHEMFGSSIHAAFRRYVESHSGALFGVVLKPRGAPADGPFGRNEVLQSRKWIDQFGDHSRLPKFLHPETSDIAQACICAQAAPCKVVEEVIRRTDRNGKVRELKIEALFNHYAILVLVWDPKSHRGIRAKRRIQTAERVGSGPMFSSSSSR